MIEKIKRAYSRASLDEESNLFLWTSFAVFLTCYLAKAMWAAAYTPVWLDEVLSIWAIRLNSPQAIWSAVQHGSEFVPPTYNILLHEYARLAGSSYLALRLPSILSICSVGICVVILFSRYIGPASAVYACCLLLESLRFTALQVRPYALGTACFALALVVWDDLNWGRSRKRPILLFICLSFAICLHFYNVLFVPCLGLVELIRLIRTRQMRMRVWLALFFAGISILVWLPLMQALSLYNAGDVASPNFYGRPSLVRLVNGYYGLLCNSRKIPIILLATMALLAVVQLSARAVRKVQSRQVLPDFWALALGISLLPGIVFAFSLLVTHTYNDRYVVAAAIGLTALIAGTLSMSFLFRQAVPLLAFLAALLTLSNAITTYGTFDRPPVFKALAKDIPIVMADVQQFFTLEESAPEPIRSRLVYLRLPSNVDLPDPTVVNQLLRWKVINPALPVLDVQTFLSSHHEFYVLDTHAGTDDSPLNYLLHQNSIDLKHQFGDGTLLFESHPHETGEPGER